MTLPPRIAKAPKRSSRWRSAAHCNFVRSYACCNCGSQTAIEVAHVRLGSGAGIGQKPHDWQTVSLCKTCHATQHAVGEVTFWLNHHNGPYDLIEAFCEASPKAAEIRKVREQ